MIESKEKNIEGDIYLVTQMTARKALRMKVRLLKHFGPILAQLVYANAENQDEQGKQNFINAIQSFAGSVNENDVESLLMDLMQGVRRNGVELTPSIIDVQFAGKTELLYQVAWFVVEVNFANFFQMLGIGNLPSSPISTTLTRGFSTNSTKA